MVARWAHNPKVVSSNLASATYEGCLSRRQPFSFSYLLVAICQGISFDLFFHKPVL